LLSPAHLVLAVGALLIMSGPLRAAWQRRTSTRTPGWTDLAPALVSALAVLSIFTFFAQYSNAYQHAQFFAPPAPSSPHWVEDTTAISYILIPAAIVMGFLLLLIRRWTLPAGALTGLITLNALMMWIEGQHYSGEYWPVLFSALAAGLLADGLYATLKPSLSRVAALRLFAFTVPFVQYLLFFLVLLLTGGIWWKIHMWLGAPVLAGAIGLGLSFLLAPPALPDAEQPA
jgi:hypothetical protein